MSCLNLGKRLQPAAKKAWKIFTKGLHSKLHKINTSKAIKKPKPRLSLKTPSPSTNTKRPVPRKLRRKRKIVQAASIVTRYHFTKRPAPVYIDELFVEPVSVAVVPTTTKRVVGQECSGTGGRRVLNQAICRVPAGTSKEGGGGSMEETSEADEMWESLGMASPLMNGINERAEEFIARIRAEMQLQAMAARSPRL